MAWAAARPSGALGEELRVVHDRRGAHGVLGEHPGGGAARGAHEQRDIGGAIGFQAGVRGGGAEAAR
jgi:hypothetical protein